MLTVRDAELVQIVDAALADASVRALRADGSSWLACRPGCTPCCHGVFRISALDAQRLRAGLRSLERDFPDAAALIQARAQKQVELLGPAFPGDAETGELCAEDACDAEGNLRWEVFSDRDDVDGPCPALDPVSGRCDLYAHRPLTCRIFGPPVRQDDGIAVCELCYRGASQQDLLHGEMRLQHHSLEEKLDAELDGSETVIAWALARQIK